MYKHILVPTDGSELSANAAREAIAVARAFGAKVTGIHVTAPFHVFAVDPVMVTGTEETYAAEVKAMAAKALSAMETLAKQKEVAFRGLHASGERPWEEIIKTVESEGCDLIVMASHGRKGVAGMLLGSETQKVLTHTKIPVLVTR